jgi:hypothetical protein
VKGVLTANTQRAYKDAKEREERQSEALIAYAANVRQCRLVLNRADPRQWRIAGFPLAFLRVAVKSILRISSRPWWTSNFLF